LTDLSTVSSKIATHGPGKLRNNSHVAAHILSPTHFSPSNQMYSGAVTRNSKQTYFVDTRQGSANSRGMIGKTHMTSSQRLDSPVEDTRMTPKRIDDSGNASRLPAI
jgi:hypothetical protein